MEANKLIKAIEENRLSPLWQGGEKHWYNLRLSFIPLVWERNLMDGYHLDVHAPDGRWEKHLYSITYDSATQNYRVDYPGQDKPVYLALLGGELRPVKVTIKQLNPR